MLAKLQALVLKIKGLYSTYLAPITKISSLSTFILGFISGHFSGVIKDLLVGSFDAIKLLMKL